MREGLLLIFLVIAIQFYLLLPSLSFSREGFFSFGGILCFVIVNRISSSCRTLYFLFVSGQMTDFSYFYFFRFVFPFLNIIYTIPISNESIEIYCE